MLEDREKDHLLKGREMVHLLQDRETMQLWVGREWVLGQLVGSRVGCAGEGMENTLEPGDKRRQGPGCRGQRRRVRADKGAGRRRRGGQVLAGEGRAAGRHLEQEVGRRGAQTRTLLGLGFSCGSLLITDSCCTYCCTVYGWYASERYQSTA